MRKTYPTDLSDEEWARLKIHLPASKLPGRLRAHSLRDILDAIFYVLRSGCPWRDVARRLPALVHRLLPLQKIPPERSMAPHLCRPAHSGEKEGRQGPRRIRGHHMDSQSMNTTEEGA